jgi:hypothetical protein
LPRQGGGKFARRLPRAITVCSRHGEEMECKNPPPHFGGYKSVGQDPVESKSFSATLRKDMKQRTPTRTVSRRGSRSTSRQNTGAAARRNVSSSRRTSASGRSGSSRTRTSASSRSRSGRTASSGRTSSSAKMTTDHDEIRQWVESRGGHPATVKRTTRSNQAAGVLRIDFPGFSGEESLKEISWDKWFETFDERKLAFLYQDKPKSRFNKLVNRGK